MVRLINQPAGGAELLELYRQSGSPDIFAQIMRAYGGMVLSVCFKVTKDAADAEDASQAVFLTLAVQCKTGAPIQYLGPWLKKVAKRTALDLIRSKKRRTRRETVTAENRPEHYDVRPGAKPEADELNVILRAELDELPGKYRMPLVLHYFGGMSHDQISKEMNCTTAALGVRLHRARKMLGKRLTARGITLEGAALGVALAAAIPAVFTDRFIQSTNAAVMSLSFGQPMMLNAAMPDNFAAVVSLVSQVGHSMARQRLKMATAVMAASITLLGGAAEAVKCLPDSLRPNLEFLAPSTLLKNLLTPSLPSLRMQTTVSTSVKLAALPDSKPELTPTVYSGTAAPLLAAAVNQPVLAMQWTVPIPPPVPATNTISLPTLTQAAKAAQAKPVAISTLATTAAALVESPRQTSAADGGFRATGGGGTAESRPAKTASAMTGDTATAGRGSRAENDLPPPPPPEAFAHAATATTPVRPVNGFEFAAVGGATFNHIPSIPKGVIGRVPGPAPLPADPSFVPSSIVLRHGEVFVHGDGDYAWADRFTGVTAGGVNSVDFSLTGVNPGTGIVSIERLPVTTTAAPDRPTGHHFVGIWAMATSLDFESIHLTAHYDVAFAESLGLPENVLKLWVFDPAISDWFRVNDGSFSRDLINHTVSGTYAGVPTFFAVSAPEPATLGVTAVAAGLLLRRRRL